MKVKSFLVFKQVINVIQSNIKPFVTLIPERLITWNSYWGLLPISILATLIFIAPSLGNRSLILTWLAIALFGHASMAPFVIYFHGKHNRKIHLLFALCMGSVRGATINLTAPVLLVEDPLQLTVRILNSAISVLYALIISAIVFSIWTNFQSDLRQILSNAIELGKSSSIKSPSNQESNFPENSQNIQQVIALISDRLHPDAPVMASKGNVMAHGVSPELDELRSLAYDGKAYLAKLEAHEIERTGISSLKVGYNHVFGYYLEVRNTHKDKVPQDWIRKQTLAQAERYITEELKIYEQKILGAEEKLQALEQQLYLTLINEIAVFTPTIQLNASLLARLDCLCSLAKVALENQYVRPSLNESYALRIVDGRHPVIEQQLPAGETYVSNDIFLDNSGQQIMMITGPNMSGKSAVLRQTALIVIMAQMGGFVPASSADIGIIDKIFTRVGASDNMSSGESTFMVEMNETASILNNLSDRSLILLDEIGRGTSTYDGVSIAWAIAEFIHDHPKFRAKTLFATHYHELNEMSIRFQRIHNFNVSVHETAQKVLFLRKLQPGGSNHSFGIHVAKMAGMPQRVIERSKEILEQLEKTHGEGVSNAERGRVAMQKSEQLSFFQLDDPALAQVRDQIMNLDLNTITPIEAMMKLHDIRKILKGK